MNRDDFEAVCGGICPPGFMRGTSRVSVCPGPFDFINIVWVISVVGEGVYGGRFGCWNV